MGWTKSLLGQYTQPYTHHVNPVRRQQQYRTSRHAGATDIIKPVVLEVVAPLNVANLATLLLDLATFERVSSHFFRGPVAKDLLLFNLFAILQLLPFLIVDH